MKNKVILVGGFNKARSLAYSLIKKDYQVTAINHNKENCLILAQIDHLDVIYGDGTKPYVLEDADIEKSDLVIALTPSDQDNLVICELSKIKFDVERTVALVNDAKKTDFFYKSGINSVVCAVNAITNIIEQQTFLEGIATILPSAESRISIAEVPISADAPTIGKRLWEIRLPDEVIIGCILRGERSLIPKGDTQLLKGDMLIVISSNQQELAAIKELTGQL